MTKTATVAQGHINVSIVLGMSCFLFVYWKMNGYFPPGFLYKKKHSLNLHMQEQAITVQYISHPYLEQLNLLLLFPYALFKK